VSAWAVSNAAYVAARLDRVCFVVINAEGELTPVAPGCRCLHLSELSLAQAPDSEVARLMAFLKW
jgi:hypothetical protein